MCNKPSTMGASAPVHRSGSSAEPLEPRRLLANPVFLSPASYAAGSGASALAAADLNGDGKVDLAVANSAGDSVSILLNNGDGSFAAKVDFPVGPHPSALAAADLTGDGRPDLAVAFGTGTASAVRLLRNNGGGAFALAGDFNSGYGPPSSVAAGDFNGDGRADLAVVNSGPFGAVDVLLNSGDGTFAPAVEYFTRPNPWSVLAADLSGDGRPDLAVVQPDDGSVRILLNRGDGTFLATADYLVGQYAYSMCTADFNADRRPDLAVASNYGPLSILLNNGNGTFGPRVDYRSNESDYAFFTRIAADDFNGDGRIDLAASASGGEYDNGLTLLLNNGDGNLGPPIEYPFGRGATTIAADFNGDRRADLAWAGGNAVTVLLNGGGSLFSQRVNYQTDARPARVVPLDIDGNGDTDLIVATLPDVTTLHRNKGNGTFSSEWRPDIPSPVAAADFNGDGRPDLVVQNTDLGVMLNLGNGRFGPVIYYVKREHPYYPSFQVAISDFDRDGRPDLAVSVFGSSRTVILLNNGEGNFRGAGQYPVEGTLSSADFNGDGKADLAVSTADGVRVLFNRGGGSFTFGGTYDAGPGSMATADFDSDGRPDIAVGTGAGISVLRNTGDGTFAPAVRYPYPAGDLAAGDFNRDGRPDVATTDLPGQNLKVFFNRGAGILTAPLAYATGGYPESVIASDLNRDAKPDLAWVNCMSNNLSVMLNATRPVIANARRIYLSPAAEPAGAFRRPHDAAARWPLSGTGRDQADVDDEDALAVIDWAPAGK